MPFPARFNFIFILMIAALVSACGMGYELLLARYLTSLTSDSVTSQSLTVGTFLLALGIGAYLFTRLPEGSPWKRLADIEIAVALLASISIPALSLLSLFFHAPKLFISLALIFPLLIGIFCGIELPLLIHAAKGYSKNAFGYVVAGNYIGALCGSLVVPLYLVPRLGLSMTLWTLCLLTAVVAVLCFLRALDFNPRLRWLGLAAALALPPWLTLHQHDFEQFYLKSFYYGAPASMSMSDLRDTFKNNQFFPNIERLSTPYQDIDIISDEAELYGGQNLNGFHLFIDQRNQFGSASEKIYHDTMVHGAVNIAGQTPKHVLIIGGGDGLIARELLRYPAVESILLIELDPAMTALANAYKPLRSINGGSLQNPRVKVEHADGFAWLRQHSDKFDAVFIDLPHPVSVDLSRLYSVEFYKIVKARLHDDGFMIFDFPFDGLLKKAGDERSEISVVNAVLAAVRDAGFPSRMAFGSWESFLIATPTARSLNFKYDALVDRIALKSVFNMAPVILPEISETESANSIFKPVTIKIRLDRGI